MCKSKHMAKQVTEPRSPARKSTSQKPNKSQKSSSSSSSRTSIYNSISSTDQSSYYFNKDSWNTRTATTSTSSTNPPLSRLRDNLPEQPHIYDFSEISSATGNLHQKPLSSSSSSTSWRCRIRNQDVVIVQQKFRRAMKIPEVTEKLGLICRSHHSSLVKLKGASISGNYIYLVYEYINGANLAECLRNSLNPNFTVLSSWMSRIKIAADIAHGLDYIHNSTGLGFNFVHNHIKSTSIIITPELDAKICHFGTSELCGEAITDKNPVSTKGIEYKRSGSGGMKLEGIRGYMAPEFQSTGMATQNTDVYSFGVVILEILSGEEALKYRFDEERGGYLRESVIEKGREAVEEGGGGGVRRWVDKRLKDSYPVEVAEKMGRLGLECVAEDPNERPGMGEVVARISKLYLESESWVENMGGLPPDFSVSLAPR